jgi:hypothetical protein
LTHADAQQPDDIIEAVVAAIEPHIIQSIDSPDGLYTAAVTVYPCVDIGEQESSYERLDLTDTRTGEVHQIAEQIINCGGLGAFGLWILRWSENGVYLYYTDAREGIPDGMVTDWVPPLWRARVADLQLESLGQAQFSPDGQQLVEWDQTQIRIRSANTDDVFDFTLLPENLMMMQVVWLPDSSGVLYIQTDEIFQSSRSTVTHIDINAQEQTILLDKVN